MSPEQFEQLVASEWESAIPEKFRPVIKNVAFLVEDEPSAEVRKQEGLEVGETLLGYYQGIPHTARGEQYGVGFTMPDTITLFRLPILEEAEASGLSVAQVIRETLWHEVAHHFGYDEGSVREKEDRRRHSHEEEK